MRLWLAALSILAITVAIVYFRSGAVDNGSSAEARRSDAVSVIKLPSPPAAGTGSVNPDMTNPDKNVASTPAQYNSQAGQKMTVIPDDPFVMSDPDRKEFFGGKFYKKVRSEARDNDWATRSEQALRASIINIPHIANGNALRTSCAETICGIRGEIPATTKDEDINTAMQDLQGKALRERAKANGLKIASSGFGADGDAMIFFVYAERMRN